MSVRSTSEALFLDHGKVDFAGSNSNVALYLIKGMMAGESMQEVKRKVQRQLHWARERGSYIHLNPNLQMPCYQLIS